MRIVLRSSRPRGDSPGRLERSYLLDIDEFYESPGIGGTHCDIRQGMGLRAGECRGEAGRVRPRSRCSRSYVSGGPDRQAVRYNAGMSATSIRELASEVAAGAREQQLYDKDFWTWTQEQAAALRRREFGAVDWDNVIEEIETLGRSERSAWTSYCANVIAHLLKIEHSPASRDLNHWLGEIVAWRGEMYDKLYENPGMKGELPEMLGTAWKRGRRGAAQKLAEYESEGGAPTTRLMRSWQQRLPAECPYCLEDIAGYDPFDKEAEPQADVWPATVARGLNEALGTDYPVRQ